MRGEVVIVPFPFSDLSHYKHRPALIIIDTSGADAVMAAITSSASDPHAIQLRDEDFRSGRLNRPSFVRPTHLFTFEKGRIIKSVGSITEQKLREVISRITILLG